MIKLNCVCILLFITVSGISAAKEKRWKKEGEEEGWKGKDADSH